jgi:hypothetical protein
MSNSNTFTYTLVTSSVSVTKCPQRRCEVEKKNNLLAKPTLNVFEPIIKFHTESYPSTEASADFLRVENSIRRFSIVAISYQIIEIPIFRTIQF